MEKSEEQWEKFCREIYTHNCSDCEQPIHEEMCYFRKPYFPHETEIVDDDGQPVEGLGICSDCKDKWPKEYMLDELNNWEGLLS